jgi:hypothetical protein
MRQLKMQRQRVMTTKKSILAVACILSALVLTSSGQVKITSFSPEGHLAWTNLAARGLSVRPVYRIDSASSLTGSWQTFTNTSETTLTNLQAFSPGAALYRVVWTNGQVWSYAGYSDQTLVATGMLYVGVSRPSNCLIDGGVYDLAQGSPYRSGFGPLSQVGCGVLDNDTIAFAPDASDNYFEIELLTEADDAWTGNWHWEGFADSARGTFVARRIINGQ